MYLCIICSCGMKQDLPVPQQVPEQVNSHGADSDSTGGAVYYKHDWEKSTPP